MIQMGNEIWQRLYDEYVAQLQPYRFTFFGVRYQVTEDDDGRLAFIRIQEPSPSLERNYAQTSQ